MEPELAGSAQVSPSIPGLRSADLPGTLGRIGPKPEHFVVEEIPAYLPKGSGEHLYLWVEKVGLNTPDVERRIAKALGIHPREVGYAGMKDRNAVTRQWFSALSKHDGKGLDLGPGVTVLASARHENKLRTGHLRGNRFAITLVDVSAPKEAPRLAEALRERKLGNFFGAQRFGRGGQNLSQAISWLKSEETTEKGPKHRGRSHFDAKLDASVVQAEIFNRYLLSRLARPEPLLEGEVVRLEGSAKCFIVEDVGQELPRLVKGDIHLTGPMIGPKMVDARGLPAELEQQARESLGLGPAELEKLGRDAPGTRRDLFIPLDDFKATELSPSSLLLEFTLPAGGYATELVREFTRTLPGERAAPAPEESPS